MTCVFLLLVALFFPLQSHAFTWSSAAEKTLEQMLDTSGKVSILTLNGRTAPAVSLAGQARFYVDSASNTVKLSVNGGAYGTLGSSSGLTGITNFGLRDTSAAFDVTIGATSSPALSADRALTINMGNVAHTLALGTTAGTITFPNAAALTVAGTNLNNSFSSGQTFLAGVSLASGTYLRSSSANVTTGVGANMTTGAIAGVTVSNAGTALTGTTGAQRSLEVADTFAPASGTATYAALSLAFTVNQTGSGITRGLYINPTLTAATDFRALEIALGKAMIVPLASASGVRYLCVDTAGLIVSQAAACSGT
mgnify:CR=1 FL=1